MTETFKDKVAIVTGANSGIGLAIATMFAEKGARVTLCGRDEERLRAALETVAKASGGHQERFLTVQGDQALASVRKDTVEKTVNKFGRLDILIANAGIVSGKDNLKESTEEVFDEIVNTNLKAVFFLVQLALPHLEKSKGTIVTTSSFLSEVANSLGIIYSASKAALDHLTRCIALDLGPKGIRVNSVNPGIVDTRVRREYGPEVDSQVLASEVSLHPLGQRLGTVEDVAKAVVFLASDESSFVTGQNLVVDGGRTFMGTFR